MKTVRWTSVAVALMVAWELLGRASYRVALLLSFPSRLATYAVADYKRLAVDAMYTGAITFSGFCLAALVGGALALAAFRWPKLRRLTIGTLQAFQVVPVLVFAPFVSMVLGVGASTHVTIAFLVGLFPFGSVLFDALARMPIAYVELVRLHQLSFVAAVKHVYLPISAPSAFAGARILISVCLVGATVAEFTGSRHGLGRNVFEGALRLEPELLTISTAAIVVLGIVGIGVLRAAERRLVRWRA